MHAPVCDVAVARDAMRKVFYVVCRHAGSVILEQPAVWLVTRASSSTTTLHELKHDMAGEFRVPKDFDLLLWMDGTWCTENWVGDHGLPEGDLRVQIIPLKPVWYRCIMCCS